MNKEQTVAAIVALGVSLAMITNWEVGAAFIVVGSLATEYRTRKRTTPTN
jgi:hypothetical protein